MKAFAYILVIILALGWIVGYFAYHADLWIHLLLLAAITIFIFRLIKQKGKPA